MGWGSHGMSATRSADRSLGGAEMNGLSRRSASRAPVDAVKQLRGRDSETLSQLGDGANSRLALGALDLRHVTRVQAGFVGHAFLAPSSSFSELLQVRGEYIERIAHKRHDLWPMPTVPGTIGTGRGLRSREPSELRAMVAMRLCISTGPEQVEHRCLQP
jgi:hypothetical protein